MMQKESRQQRRARERAERRSQERPTFDRMLADIDRSRTTQLVKNHAGNRLPFRHELNAYKLESVFGPLFKWFDTLEQTGDMEVTDKGVPIFLPFGETEYVPLIDSFESMCDTFENIASKRGLVDQTGGLRRLAKKLAVDMPLFQADTDAARATLDADRLRAVHRDGRGTRPLPRSGKGRPRPAPPRVKLSSAFCSFTGKSVVKF